jgi:hypothetical protein
MTLRNLIGLSFDQLVPVSPEQEPEAEVGQGSVVGTLGAGPVAEEPSAGSPRDPNNPQFDIYGNPMDPNPEVRGGFADVASFATFDPGSFEASVNWLSQNVFAGDHYGYTDVLEGFINAWGDRYFSKEGHYPNVTELTQYAPFLKAAPWVKMLADNPNIPAVAYVKNPGGQVDLVTADPILGVEMNPIGGPRIGVDIPAPGGPPEVEISQGERAGGGSILPPPEAFPGWTGQQMAPAPPPAPVPEGAE